VNTPIVAQVGSVPLTVTYGKTYQASIVDATTKAAIATLQITTRRPDAPSPVPCRPVTQSNWKVVPYGTYAEVPVTTDQPAFIVVEASTDAPKPDGTFEHVDSAAISFLPTASWTGMLPKLNPNTTYYVVVKIKDATNCDAYKVESGSFKTLYRRVDVMFGTIHVTDNSDFSDHCECTFFFKVGNTPAGQFGEVGIFDGQDVFPNQGATWINAPDAVALQVSGFDNDENCGFFSPCTCGLPSGVVADSGSNKCFDWSSAGKTLDVTGSGPSEAFDGTFSIVAHGGPLKFEVYGGFKVSYIVSP
jgi:hypothetical protein